MTTRSDRYARRVRQRAPGSVDRITPLWLSHHWPEDYDRCVRIGRSHVCRRCLVLYPIAFVGMLVLRGSWPPAADVVVVAILPLPAVIELVLEQAGVLRYRAARQVVVTVPLAVGLGRGFARYLDDQADLLFWGVALGYSAVCGLAVLWRVRRDGRGGSDGIDRADGIDGIDGIGPDRIDDPRS